MARGLAVRLDALDDVIIVKQFSDTLPNVRTMRQAYAFGNLPGRFPAVVLQEVNDALFALGSAWGFGSVGKAVNGFPVNWLVHGDVTFWVISTRLSLYCE
jgi:hypothetical protein